MNVNCGCHCCTLNVRCYLDQVENRRSAGGTVVLTRGNSMRSSIVIDGGQLSPDYDHAMREGREIWFA